MTVSPALFTRLLDDAAIFPPGNAPLPDAVADHCAHGERWYADMLGPFVCDTARLDALAEVVERVECGAIDVALVVPEAGFLPKVIDTVESAENLRLAALEVALGPRNVAEAASLVHAVGPAVPAYLEVPARSVDLDVLRTLLDLELVLKLRTGGTDAAAFPTADELAHAILLCVRTGAAFKCTAGLHHAVRHRDPATGFAHHGFLNVIAAVALALDGADQDHLTALLADSDPARLGADITAFDDGDVAAIRRIFRSFGTCSIREPVDGLVDLQLVRIREPIP